MIVAEKPPLEEAYLEHFGVKGMKWGVRKSKDSSDDSKDTVIRITHKQKVNALTAVGAVTAVALLHKTGGLSPLLAGSSKIAAEGAKVSGRILKEGGMFAARSTFAATKFAASSVYNVGSTAAKTVGVMIGRSSVRASTASSPFRNRVNDLIARAALRRGP